MPASAASRIESAAKRGGTKIIAVFAPVSVDGLVEGVEDRDALDVLAALAGRHARRRPGCRSRGCCSAWNVPSRPVMPDTHSRVLLVDEDAHAGSSPWLRQLDDLLGGLVHRRRGVRRSGRLGLGQQLAALDVVGAVEAHDERDRRA